MIRRSMLLVLLLTMTLGAAQAAEALRAVLLTDGSVVTGQVLERTAELLVLEDEDGDVWRIPMEDIVEVRVVTSRDDAEEEWADEGFSGPDIYDDRGLGPGYRDPELSEAGVALAVAPMVPMMASGMVFTAVGGLFGVDGLTALGFNLTGGALGFAIGGSRLALDYSGNPQRATLQHQVGLGLAISGLGLFDVATIFYRLVPPRGTDAVYGFSGIVTLAMGLMISGNVTLAASSNSAREQAGFVSAAPPMPYASVVGEGFVVGVAGSIGPRPFGTARGLH